MVLTFSKATKNKRSKNALFKLHTGENKSRQILVIQVWFIGQQHQHHLGACQKYTLGPCPRPTESELAFQPDLPVIQIGTELFPLRPTDPSCQILAKVPTNCFSLHHESMYVGPESLLLFTSTISNISMLSLMSICFFLTQQQSLFVFGSLEIVSLLLSLEHI